MVPTFQCVKQTNKQKTTGKKEKKFQCAMKLSSVVQKLNFYNEETWV